MSLKSDMQKLFNIAARGLLRQMKKSQESGRNNPCLYRHVELDGKVLHCAIGMMIPDEKITKEIRDCGSLRNGLPVQKAVSENNGVEMSASMIDFLQRLQAIHDAYGVDEWKQKLTEFAKENSLRMPNVERERKQEIFNRVVKHLRQQKVRAYNDQMCCYRTVKDGKTLKCAVGCLIRDEDYKPEMEGAIFALDSTSIVTQDIVLAVVKGIGYELTTTEGKLLRELQTVHDGHIEGISHWEAAFEVVAKSHNLRYYPSQKGIKRVKKVKNTDLNPHSDLSF